MRRSRLSLAVLLLALATGLGCGQKQPEYTGGPGGPGGGGGGGGGDTNDRTDGGLDAGSDGTVDAGSLDFDLQMGTQVVGAGSHPLYTVALGLDGLVNVPISTVSRSGSGQQISFALSSLPVGVNATFSQPTIFAGGYVTLTFTADGSAVTGTTQELVRATDLSGNLDVVFNLQVDAGS